MESLNELLEFAVKHRALEMRFAPGLPPMVVMADDPEPRRVNVPALQAIDFEAMLARLVDPETKGGLKFGDRHEVPYEIAGLGRFVVQISKAQIVFLIPPPPAAPPGKTGFFRKLFGH